MVPLHVTVPLATSWISMDRAAQVNASQVHYMQSCAKRVSLFFVQTRHTPHHLAFILHSTYHHHMFKEESPKHVKPTSPLMYVELLHTPGFRAYVLYISIRSYSMYLSNNYNIYLVFLCSTFSAEIDECEVMTDNCHQNCTNTEGSFTCSCSSGFILLSDERSCAG